MKLKIFLLLTVILLASGCISTDSTTEPEKSFEQLLNKSDNSTFQISYSVSSPEIRDKTKVTMYRKNSREAFKAVKKSPGGKVISESYSLENTTVSCYTSPSPRGGATRCTVGQNEGIYNFLRPERWELGQINFSGRKNISERQCRSFSTELEVDGQGLVTGDVKADICLDQEKGFVSEMNVSSSEGYTVGFKAENYSSKVDERGLELPRAVGIVGHCTDSFDVELTPFRDVDQAIVSVNGENKTVELPSRFQTEFYEIPRDELSTGENTIKVYTEQTVQSRYCYRRPQ